MNMNETNDIIYVICNEGLIKSYNEKIGNLLKHIGILNVTIYNPTQVEINQSLTDKQASDLKQLLAVAGWFVSKPHKNNDPDYWFKTKDYKEGLLLEPKYDELSFNNVPDELYHVSYVGNRHLIEGRGLRPRDKSQIAYHPERIYLSPSLEYARYTRKLFANKPPATGEIRRTEDDYDIWEIPKKLLDNQKFHSDPNFPKHHTVKNTIPQLNSAALFVLEPINRHALSLKEPGANYDKRREEDRLRYLAGIKK